MIALSGISLAVGSFNSRFVGSNSETRSLYQLWAMAQMPLRVGERGLIRCFRGSNMGLESVL